MVDFRKKLGGTKSEKKINPIEIYDQLDRKSEAGPLRPAQFDILTQWYSEYQDEKDVILKLHTGQGKTLIGLLILQSVINSAKGPALYVCPNIYLVDQTFEQAQKFGIKCCLIGPDNQLPDDFINGNKILVTHVQKVFNGFTKFKLGTQALHVDTIILDDSHACIDSIRDALTINISDKHEVYNEIVELFEDDLKSQGEGSFLEIQNKEYSTFLPVPYWAWIEKKDSVLAILSKHKENDQIKFVWPLIKDRVENCQCFISGHTIEISPYINPIWEFGTFYNARQRVLMSATTLDDSFFIKGLGLDVSAIEKPLVYKDEKWSGEKMILIPSLIDHYLDRIAVINFFTKLHVTRFGIVIITPSFGRAKLYEELGASIARTENIFKEVKELKELRKKSPVVFVNRYDGIDLPDDACRILIIDSKPSTEALSDRYEETRRENSEVVNIKIAQKIEQGLGRSVRGEKDYCAIILIGPDLVNFIKSNRTKNYFSKQTQKQIEIGFEIVKLSEDEKSYDKNSMDIVVELIKKSTKRDDDWKDYYVEEMNCIEAAENRTTLHEILTLERDAEKKYFSHDYLGATKTIQRVVDKFPLNSLERGWYLQILARYKYLMSKSESIQLQKSAFTQNHGLLNPKDGIVYEKMNFINENRIAKINSYLSKFDNYSELALDVDDICSRLSFTEDSETFGEALKNIGTILGFLSQRPDKEFKRGPDNLWCCGNNEYILFECKNEVDEKRSEISKTEASQLNTAITWFKKEYIECRVKPIMVIHTKTLAKNGVFDDDVRIMRKEKINRLKKNVKAFFLEFKAYDNFNLSDSKINDLLQTHKLDINSLMELYSEEFYHKKI